MPKGKSGISGSIGEHVEPTAAGDTHRQNPPQLPIIGGDEWNVGLVSRMRCVCGGRTFKKLGELTKTHPESVRRYLTGSSAAQPAFLAALCEAFGVSETWLLAGRGNTYREDSPNLQFATPVEIVTALRESLREAQIRAAKLEWVLLSVVRNSHWNEAAAHVTLKPRRLAEITAARSGSHRQIDAPDPAPPSPGHQAHSLPPGQSEKPAIVVEPVPRKRAEVIPPG